MNRAQRRSFLRDHRRRGLGFTRQFSSTRARRIYGRLSAGQQQNLPAYWRRLLGWKTAGLSPAFDRVASHLQPEVFGLPENPSSEDAIIEYLENPHVGTTLDDFLVETFGEEGLAEIQSEMEMARYTEEQEELPDWQEGQASNILSSASAKDLIAAIKAGQYDDCLLALQSVETASKNRKTVLAAIQNQLNP